MQSQLILTIAAVESCGFAEIPTLILVPPAIAIRISSDAYDKSRGPEFPS
jgi:hypothetical protein